ncbi:hypothetical protein MIR68_001592 [Amoeboaphelidium protococcarum]|nr:hypothetical protein MIR68_001592 [Amoeboaphelidium protococcarum]
MNFKSFIEYVKRLPQCTKYLAGAQATLHLLNLIMYALGAVTLVRFLAFLPANPAQVWRIFTSSLIEPSLIMFFINIAVTLSVGQQLERQLGSVEFVRLITFTVATSTIITYLVLLCQLIITAAAGGNVLYWYDTMIYGQWPILSAYMVALKYLEPNQVVKMPQLSLTVQYSDLWLYYTSALGVFALITSALRFQDKWLLVDSVSFWSILLPLRNFQNIALSSTIAVFSSWYYLRFQSSVRVNTLIDGGVDHFAFMSFLPQSTHKYTKYIVDALYKLASKSSVLIPRRVDQELPHSQQSGGAFNSPIQIVNSVNANQSNTYYQQQQQQQQLQQPQQQTSPLKNPSPSKLKHQQPPQSEADRRRALAQREIELRLQSQKQQQQRQGVQSNQ